MSGVVHSIGKVFSRIWDFIRPIVIVVAIAVAIYFTAGLALSAFPATAGFAAAMPGFAAGGVAGAGVFSHVAVSMGLGTLGSSWGGGLVAGAASANAAAGITTAAATAAGSIAAPAAATTAAGGVGGTGLTQAGINAGLAPTTGAATGATAAHVGMSLTDKLLIASTVAKGAGALMAPSQKDIEAAKKSWYGAFYGMNSDGTSAKGNEDAQPAQAPKAAGGSSSLVPGVNIPQMSAPSLNTGASTPQPVNTGAGLNTGAASPNAAASAPNLGQGFVQTPQQQPISLVPPTEPQAPKQVST